LVFKFQKDLNSPIKQQKSSIPILNLFYYEISMEKCRLSLFLQNFTTNSKSHFFLHHRLSHAIDLIPLTIQQHLKLFTLLLPYHKSSVISHKHSQSKRVQVTHLKSLIFHNTHTYFFSVFIFVGWTAIIIAKPRNAF